METRRRNGSLLDENGGYVYQVINHHQPATIVRRVPPRPPPPSRSLALAMSGAPYTAEPGDFDTTAPCAVTGAQHLSCRIGATGPWVQQRRGCNQILTKVEIENHPKWGLHQETAVVLWAHNYRSTKLLNWQATKEWF